MVKSEVRYRRSVSGHLESSSKIETSLISIEKLRRSSETSFDWDYRQPRISLFWYTRGSGECHLNINGEIFRSCVTPDHPLSVFPAQSDIHGKFHFEPICEYTIILIDPSIAANRLGVSIERPIIGFSDPDLIQSLKALSNEVTRRDAYFSLYAEGWMCQALVHLARALGVQPKQKNTDPHRGGLAVTTLRKVEEYIHANISHPISLRDLSDVAGLSTRHMLRAFRESKGLPPHRYILELRLREARRILSSTDDSITDIALACGFRQSQYFSTIFRRVYGISPSLFRHRTLHEETIGIDED